MRPDVLADHVGQAIRGAVAPLALKVAELEAAGGRAGIAYADVQASLGDLGTRLALLEQTAPIPGPPGAMGPPGPPGRDGGAGKLLDTYRDDYQAGQTYDAGDTVTDHGSLFLCKRMTQARPGASPDWKLIVKRGRDGKDAR